MRQVICLLHRQKSALRRSDPGTYAPFFFDDPPIGVDVPGFVTFPANFVAQYLPATAWDGDDHVQLSFSWVSDPNGRVTSGVIMGPTTGPVNIRFAYLQ